MVINCPFCNIEQEAARVIDDVLKEVFKHEKKMWTALVPSERKKFTELFRK